MDWRRDERDEGFQVKAAGSGLGFQQPVALLQIYNVWLLYCRTENKGRHQRDQVPKFCSFSEELLETLHKLKALDRFRSVLQVNVAYWHCLVVRQTQEHQAVILILSNNILGALDVQAIGILYCVAHNVRAEVISSSTSKLTVNSMGI